MALQVPKKRKGNTGRSWEGEDIVVKKETGGKAGETEDVKQESESVQSEECIQMSCGLTCRC